MSSQKAKQYWKSQSVYPFSFTKGRRIHELNYLIPRLEKYAGKRLLDLGCGDGSLLECLLRLIDYEEWYGFDIAEDLLSGIDPRVKTQVYDLTSPGSLPEVDITLVAGVIQYVFDDSLICSVMSQINSPIVFLRSTCTLKPENESVVNDGYASLYRTLPNTLELISREFTVTAVDRIYPDEIESPYGTKQFYFEAHR